MAPAQSSREGAATSHRLALPYCHGGSETVRRLFCSWTILRGAGQVRDPQPPAAGLLATGVRLPTQTDALANTAALPSRSS